MSTAKKKRKPLTKDTQVIVRMSAKDKDRYTKDAFKAGLSLSEYIRSLLEKNS